MNPFLSLLLLILLASTPRFGSAATQHTNGMWNGYFMNKSLEETVSFHQEFQIRTNWETGNTVQSLFRGGPLWKWNESLELGLLFAHVRTGPQTENRLTEQVSYTWSKTFFTRFRFEQRTLEKTDGLSLRMRLLVRYVHPMNDHHSFVLWDEYFIQPTRPHWIYDDLFDRNRYFFGVRSKWKAITIEYGYMNQFTNRSGRDLSEHLFLLYLIL